MTSPTKLPPPKAPPTYPVGLPWNAFPVAMPFLPPQQNHPQSSSAAAANLRVLQFPLHYSSYPPVATVGRGLGRPVYKLRQPSSVARGASAAAARPPHSSVPPPRNKDSTNAKKSAAVIPTRSNLRSQGNTVSETTAPAAIRHEKTPMSLTNLIGLAFTTLLSQPHLRNKWLTSGGIIAMLKKRYNFTGELDFSEAKFHKAIVALTVNCVDIQDETNPTGIFRIQREVRRHENFQGKKRVWLYYVMDPDKPMGKLPVASLQLLPKRNPKSPTKKTTERREAKSDCQGTSKRKRPVLDWSGNSKHDPVQYEPEETSLDDKKKIVQEAWEKLYTDAQDICNQEVERRDSKRQRIKDAVDCELERHVQLQKNQDMEKKALARAKEQHENRRKAAESVRVFCYFDSTEAKSLLRPREGETVQECLKQRINLLELVINDPNAFSQIVALKEDEAGFLPEPSLMQRHKILHKAMVLRLSYIYALELLEKGHSYAHCCKKALEDVRRITSLEMGSGSTAEAYNREFREKQQFQPPYQKPPRKSGKKHQKKNAATDASEDTAQGLVDGGVAEQERKVANVTGIIDL